MPGWGIGRPLISAQARPKLASGRAFFVWHLTPARRPAKIEHAHEDDTPKAALRPWRASIIRKKLDRIGRVWVADPATAEKVAIEEFHLDEHERKRLSVEEVR